MFNEIIVNATKQETRVALMEGGQLAQLFIERRKDASLIGNIYKGRVIRVLPGMQSAFVDIGLSKAAFLYVRDVFSELNTSIFGEELEEYSDHLDYPIEEILQEGEEILLQVSKDPIGSKGARGTSYITLPGRYLVLMPGLEHIGISRRIQEEEERIRLKELIEAIKPDGYGFIVRTASDGCCEEELRKDMDFLTRLWTNIQKKKEHSSSPSLLYSDLDLITRIVRDLFSNVVARLVIDNEREYENLLEFVETYFPVLSNKIHLYENSEPIFEAFSIELEIKRALGRRVWLKSGGYIVIDQTEALTAIDVNTGKYVGKESLEETIMSTNLESVKEIAYQIRLRNLGGIIIVDFIDMEEEENRKKLLQAFQEAMSKDRAKTTILQVSDLGLIEMTRKRVRESLGRTLCDVCPYCEGRGVVKSPSTICYEIFRELKKIGSKRKDVKIVINTHTSVSDLLYDEERESLEELEKRFNFNVIIKSDKDIHQENYNFTIL